MASEKSKYRMSGSEIFFLCSIAGFADILTMIPFVGDIIAPIFWIGFTLYLFVRGLGFVNVSRLIPEAVSFVAELIPGIQELPTIIVGTVIIIIIIRIEDRTGLKLTKPGSIKNLSEQGKQALARGTKALLKENNQKLPSPQNVPNRIPERQQMNAERFKKADNARKNPPPLPHPENQVPDNEESLQKAA